MTMDYGVFELESDDDERTRRQRDASIRATRGLVAPEVYRPCGCNRRGRHRKVCRQSAAWKREQLKFDQWEQDYERRIRAGVLLPGF